MSKWQIQINGKDVDLVAAMADGSDLCPLDNNDFVLRPTVMQREFEPFKHSMAGHLRRIN